MHVFVKNTTGYRPSFYLYCRCENAEEYCNPSSVSQIVPHRNGVVRCCCFFVVATEKTYKCTKPPTEEAEATMYCEIRVTVGRWVDVLMFVTADGLLSEEGEVCGIVVYPLHTNTRHETWRCKIYRSNNNKRNGSVTAYYYLHPLD